MARVRTCLYFALYYMFICITVVGERLALDGERNRVMLRWSNLRQLVAL